MANKTIRHRQDKLDCTPPGRQFMSHAKRAKIAARPTTVERLSLEQLVPNVLQAGAVSAFLSQNA